MRPRGAWLIPLILFSLGCASLEGPGRVADRPALTVRSPVEDGSAPSRRPSGEDSTSASLHERLRRFWSGEHRDTVGLGPAKIDDGDDIEFPNIHDPPLERYGFPTERHDPFLFPSLMNLVEENPRFDDDSPEADLRQRINRRRQFNIRFPGADTANFPNSSYTLPKGRAYVENSPFMLTGPTDEPTTAYNWEFLLRYGLTDNLELRLFSNGLTATSGPRGTTGFSPIAFDMKVHLWGENPRYFVPAAGLEVYLQTPFGSPAFSSGTQPSITLLLDKSLPRDWSVSVNIGVTGDQSPLIVDQVESQETFYLVTTQWALQKQFNEDLMLFYHGYVNSSNLPRVGDIRREEDTTSVVQGFGASYTINDRVSTFGSYNLGAGRTAPDYFAQWGFAVAF